MPASSDMCACVQRRARLNLKACAYLVFLETRNELCFLAACLQALFLQQVAQVSNLHLLNVLHVWLLFVG